MRIYGGKWAGLDLVSPGGRVRPTAEEVRAAWLEDLEDEVAGARILELFAGTGAVGLEALSRGALSCDFVESNPAALHALKANVARTRSRDRTRIFKRDALDFVANLPHLAYDVAFADPPYQSRQLDRLLEAWDRHPFARILTVEHAADHVLPRKGVGWRIGDSRVTTFRTDDARRSSRAKRPPP